MNWQFLAFAAGSERLTVADMTLDFPDTSSSKSTSTQTAHQISGSDLSVSDIESSISFQCTEVGAEKIEFSNSPQNASSETSFRTSSILKWWLPEIVASTLSVATLFSLALILRLYEKRNITDLRLLSSLTLNGLIAVISTLNRVLLMVPVGSILSQEGWHWFAEKDQRKRCKSSLGDLDALDQAARGAWGSLIFLFCSRLRQVSETSDTIDADIWEVGIPWPLLSLVYYP
ncbi:uncharacterized protein LY89DRAFT_99197 [Mollisia scopiformis]|uniref:Uncharacterized protein n=1 Tax=Mollisia scopiformis TaxID=149040 RepID=A0A194X772_MOLSC|nr:uncharacterized protein LY89DRAFT_99197 [Mollisia scopiformis]KUJ15929.1 hypothetical protein LY89DRAFT_99197 [Mollisia scopiformis]